MISTLLIQHKKRLFSKVFLSIIYIQTKLIKSSNNLIKGLFFCNALMSLID